MADTERCVGAEDLDRQRDRDDEHGDASMVEPLDNTTKKKKKRKKKRIVVGVASDGEINKVALVGTGEKNAGPKILEENEYVERLGRIIRRDFFPDAVKSDDADTLNALEDNKYGVDGFQRMYTTEDNASFEVLQEKGIQEKRKKFAWAKLEDKKSTNQLLLGDKVYSTSEQLEKEALKRADTGKVINHAGTRLFEHATSSSYSVSSGATKVTDFDSGIPTINGYSLVTEPRTETNFKVKKRSRREELGIDLGRKVEQQKGAKVARASRKPGGLSNAGISLAEKLLKRAK
uniref:Uncharacterized protein n=1 Tax=Mucochytrium quahogii TaxID=96639 RepID=A0A7S2RX56_9STRA|mmetsp:Transcript_2394/g.3473  ORF Transcript_2394/g.3473 Transcript_2394/m.3473 type:complete len:290 (-) Transcript_2394:847-1716(-)|eukprot:CAMPEP_0203775554 /NCGR_PEP_ID=MMETSP0099_2-20121227/6176_1 /ASSEMBLY_ACC=CAM_ASM_000209 /TAXON_ID=96639 /ORGANISM=" , Strain NY0313808BC1" /LENGTH=289 /DNA_ID=CAMNT_0050674305 /DNA_START=112 /DNA_END=981 /DNA_ORIENTATION=-